MAAFTMTRRTGALLAGVVPPGGIPLPQQTLGIGTWVGSPRDLAEPAFRAELLRLTSMRRELRAGHLLSAARISLEVQDEALPPDSGTTRTIAVLRAVGAAYSEQLSEPREDLLQASLVILGPSIPPMLLDSLLAPSSRLAPEAVEHACLDHDRSPSTVARLRVLLLRRAAQDHRAKPDGRTLSNLQRRVAESLDTPMHESLRQWAEAVGRRSETDGLSKLIAAVGYNLPLTDPRNADLHQQLTRCFDRQHDDSEMQRRLARLSFSAWCTLRDATDGSGAGELVAFSVQAAAFRQVFEVLLERALLQRFLGATGREVKNKLLEAIAQGKATLGIGRWYGLLFAARHAGDGLADAMQVWFQRDPQVSALREDQRLRTALGDLLQIRLHALPHDEEAARATASDVLDTVARVGFGASNALDLPKRGDGLVGQLAKVAM